MKYIRFYKVGQSWVLCCKFERLGLIHLASPYWWKPLQVFPRALYRHLRLALR